MSLYRSPDINKPYYECLQVEYNTLFKPDRALNLKQLTLFCTNSDLISTMSTDAD